MTATDLVRAAYAPRQDDDWSQVSTLVREVMDDEQRDRLVHTVVQQVSDGVEETVLTRVFAFWRHIDPHLGKKIEECVRGNIASNDAL
jgi:catalase